MLKTRFDRLAVRRRGEAKGMGSIQAIAEAANVHPNTLYNNLDGHNWQIEIVDKVANALGCKSTDLMVVEEVRG